MTLYQKLRKARQGDTFDVRTKDTGLRFTIHVAEFAGLRGYACIAEGSNPRARMRHRILEPDVLRDWANMIEEYNHAA